MSQSPGQSFWRYSAVRKLDSSSSRESRVGASSWSHHDADKVRKKSSSLWNDIIKDVMNLIRAHSC